MVNTVAIDMVIASSAGVIRMIEPGIAASVRQKRVFLEMSAIPKNDLCDFAHFELPSDVLAGFVRSNRGMVFDACCSSVKIEKKDCRRKAEKSSSFDNEVRS